MKSKIKIIIVITALFMFFFLNLKAEPVSSLGNSEKKIEDVTKKVFPSVVRVEARNRTKKVATGVVFDKKGHIVTTALISPRDEKITVITSEGKRIEAEFMGMDYETHIALLRVKEGKLMPITTGKAKKLSAGSWIGVVSISPEGTPSITQGIVSSIAGDKIRLNVWVMPGSSGCPVVTRAGQMIGLLRGIYFDDKPIVFEFREKELVGSGYVLSKAEAPSSGMALAVPIEVVKTVASEIKEKGKVERGWLGVSITDDGDGQVKIVDVERESPAELAGLKEGDIILRVEGKEITSAKILASEIRKRKPGQNITLEIERDGKKMEVKVKLGEYPEREIKKEFELKFPRLFPPAPPKSPKAPKSFKAPEPPKIWPKEWFYQSWESRKYIGVYLEEIERELSEHFGLKEGRGLLVSKFSEDSAAERAGLKVGDVIIKADGVRVETVEGLSELIQDKKKGEKVKIEFLRNKKRKSIEVAIAEEKRGGIFGGFYSSKDWDDYLKPWEKYSKEWKEQYKKWQEKYDKNMQERMKKLRESIFDKSRKAAEKIELLLLREYRTQRV